MHFGADYSSGKYGWTTNRDKIDREIDTLMKKLHTDYIDFGFIHCIDEPSDLRQYINGGVLERIKELHKQDVVRHIWRRTGKTGTLPPLQKGNSWYHHYESICRWTAS